MADGTNSKEMGRQLELVYQKIILFSGLVLLKEEDAFINFIINPRVFF